MKDFKGYLHTDGWDEYHRKLPDAITVVGCWARYRRKFDEALTALAEKDRAGSESLRGKQFCDRLSALERTYAGLPPDDNFKARRLAREERGKPVMEECFSCSGPPKKEARSISRPSGNQPG